MRRLLRDMRHLAADLARRGLRIEADKVLGISATLPSVKQSSQIRAIRWLLLAVQDELRERHLTNTQDALTGVLTQLRAIEQGLEG